MKKMGLILGLIFATGAPAFSDPVLDIWAGDFNVDISLTQNADGTWGIAAPESFAPSNGASFTLNYVKLDADPLVSYAIGVKNTSATATPYTFSFSTPVSLTPGLYSVEATLGGSLTDGGSDGVTLSPTSGPVQQSFIDTADAGVDVLNTTITDSASPRTQNFGTFDSASTYNLTSSASNISVSTAFTLSGGNDSASASGSFEVASVPEPSSYALGGLCLLAFLAARRQFVL